MEKYTLYKKFCSATHRIKRKPWGLCQTGRAEYQDGEEPSICCARHDFRCPHNWSDVVKSGCPFAVDYADKQSANGNSFFTNKDLEIECSGAEEKLKEMQAEHRDFYEYSGAEDDGEEDADETYSSLCIEIASCFVDYLRTVLEKKKEEEKLVAAQRAAIAAKAAHDAAIVAKTIEEDMEKMIEWAKKETARADAVAVYDIDLNTQGGLSKLVAVHQGITKKTKDVIEAIESTHLLTTESVSKSMNETAELLRIINDAVEKLGHKLENRDSIIGSSDI